MGQKLLGGVLRGLGTGIGTFGQAVEAEREQIRSEQLFELQRRAALLDLRNGELDLERTKALLEEDKKAGLRDEELHKIDLQLQQVAADIAVRENEYQVKYGEKLGKFRFDKTRDESLTAASNLEAAKLRRDAAQLDLNDRQALAAALPPEERAQAEADAFRRADKLARFQDDADEAQFKFDLLIDPETGRSNGEQRLHLDLRVGELTVQNLEEQNRREFAEALFNSDDPAEHTAGREMLLELNPSLSDEEKATIRGTSAAEEEETPARGPSLASEIFGFQPIRAIREAIPGGEETVAREDDLRKLDKFAREEEPQTLKQVFRGFKGSAVGGRPLSFPGEIGRALFGKGEVLREQEEVFDPNKDEKVPRSAFSYEIDAKDRERLLRELSENDPEEFGRFQSLPEHEQRIFLARAASRDSELQNEISMLPQTDLSVLQIGGALLGQGIPGLSTLFKSKLFSPSKPIGTPSRTEAFPRSPEGNIMGLRPQQPSGPIPRQGPQLQLPVPRQTFTPTQQPSLGPPNVIPSAPVRPIAQPSAGVPQFPKKEVTPEEMQLFLDALRQAMGERGAVL